MTFPTPAMIPFDDQILKHACWNESLLPVPARIPVRRSIAPMSGSAPAKSASKIPNITIAKDDDPHDRMSQHLDRCARSMEACGSCEEHAWPTASSSQA